MPHPDLYDELTQTLIAGFDAGTLYARIDGERGLTWQPTTPGGHDIDGILWTDENQLVPLDDIGVNKEIGFYQLSAFPVQWNDAEMPPHDTDL